MEKRIRNELTLKRWRRFKANRRAYYSMFVIILMLVITLVAPLLANNQPVVLKYKDQFYFPVFKTYQAKEFSIIDDLYVNYRTLPLTEKDWAIWPVIKWDPFESNKEVESYPSAPSKNNIFGTDESGRDVLTRVIYGFKYSIIYALSVWFLSYLVGIMIGGAMGYFGGWFDLIGQRAVEILSTIPSFFLLLILIANFQPNIIWLIFISVIFGWIGISYYVRGEFLKNRKLDYVEAARCLGNGHFRILFKHILPNSLSPVITFSPFFIAGSIIGLASLDFLGFGLPVPTPSWGELLNQGFKHSSTAWWLAVYPSMALYLTVLFFTFMGEGVRDAMDPHLK